MEVAILLVDVGAVKLPPIPVLEVLVFSVRVWTVAVL